MAIFYLSKTYKYCFGLSLLMAVILPHESLRADLDDALTADGWEEIVFDEKKPNLYSKPVDAGDGSGLSVDILSVSSVSVAFKKVDISLKETPVLAFSWLSRNPDPDTDTSKKGGDDRTLALYVAFPYQPDKVPFSERLERKFVELLEGKDTPGRVLNYVWGGGAAAGEGFENPYTGKYGHMIIVNEPGTPLNVWHEHKVDVYADFIKVFGYEPANPVYVGVGADSDDTEIVINASVRDMRFVED